MPDKPEGTGVFGAPKKVDEKALREEAKRLRQLEKELREIQAEQGKLKKPGKQ